MAPVAKGVLELLEMAHGLSLMGSIMPLRQAAFECGVSHGSVTWNLAQNLINEQLGERATKPSREEYALALEHAIEQHIARESVPLR